MSAGIEESPHTTVNLSVKGMQSSSNGRDQPSEHKSFSNTEQPFVSKRKSDSEHSKGDVKFDAKFRAIKTNT